MVKAITPIKKRWFPVHSPATFGNNKIGEIYLADAQAGIGRTLDLSLMSLAGDPSKQSVYVKFTITKVENNILQTEITGFRLITAAVKKMSHRGRDRIGGSFIIATKDGKNLRVKPILVTKGRAKGAVLTHLRRDVVNSLVTMIGEYTYDDLIKELCGHQFQRQLQQKIRKIYPVGVCEIRYLALAKTGTPLKPTAVEQVPVEEDYSEELPEEITAEKVEQAPDSETTDDDSVPEKAETA